MKEECMMIKKYTRLICMVLMMCMLFSNVCIKADASEDMQLNRAFSLLSALGVVSQDTDIEKLDVTRVVTRADFAVYFASMLNIDAENKQELYYNDMPNTHYAYNEITALTEMKYLYGSDKKFNPDEPIAMDHAVAMLVRAITPAGFMYGGAQEEVFIKGLISDAELLDGVSRTQNVSYRDMFLMLFNTLKADCYRLGSMDGDGMNYVREKGHSLLYKTRGMYYVENKTATAANGADIYGLSENVNDVVIDNVPYNSKGSDYSSFLGRRIDFVYTEDDNDIVWMFKRGKDQVVEFFFDEECRYDAQSRIIHYYDGTREKRVQLSPALKVIYNGKFVSSGLSQILSTPRYNVTLLKLDNNDDYNVAIINAYTNIVVGEKDDKKLYIYDKNNGTKLSLDSSDYSLLRIQGAEGDVISYEDIQRNSVLSVFKSKDGDFLKVVVSNEIVSGFIKDIDRDAVITATVDDTVYKIYSTAVADAMSVGANLTAYLDYMGYISSADISFTGKNQFVGYILKGYCDSMDEVIGLTVLSESSSVDKYLIQTKVNINGKNYKNMQEAYDVLAPGGNLQKALVLFTLSEEGTIKRIDTPQRDNGPLSPLVISKELDNNLQSKWQATYRAAQGKIGLTMLGNSATKVFYVPDDFTDIRQCSVGKLIAESDYRGAVSYRTTNDTFYEQYIVVRRSLGTVISDTSSIIMYDKTKKKINADGEVFDAIIGHNGRQEASYEVSDRLKLSDYNLSKGDAIQLGLDGEGNVDTVRVLYRNGSNTELTSNGGLLWPDKEGRIITCYANDKMGSALKVGWSSGNTFDEIFNLNSSVPIVVYDSESKKVEAGSMSDIKTYKTNSGNPSKLIIQTNYSVIYQILVYN